MNRSFVFALSAIAVIVTCFVLPGLSAALSSPQDAKAKVEVSTKSKKLGKKLRFVETKNFTWASSMSAGKTKIVSAGAEKAYKIFADHAGINEWAKMWGNQKCMAILVPAKRDYIRFNKWFAENYKVWSKKQWPINKDLADYYCESAARRIMTTYVKPNSDAHVRAIITHLTGHMLVLRYKFHNNFVPPWLEEGMAVYMEARVNKKHACKCFNDPYGSVAVDPNDPVAGYPTAKWKVATKKASKKGKLKSIKAMMRVRLAELELADAQKAYATVSWMMSQDKKCAEFIAAMKRAWPREIAMEYETGHGEAQAKAFKEVFGMSLPEVDKAIAKHIAKKL